MVNERRGMWLRRFEVSLSRTVSGSTSVRPRRSTAHVTLYKPPIAFAVDCVPIFTFARNMHQAKKRDSEDLLLNPAFN